jgi:hypothetical protein
MARGARPARASAIGDSARGATTRIREKTTRRDATRAGRATRDRARAACASSERARGRAAREGAREGVEDAN